MVHRSCYELELAILISVSARCAEKEEDGLTLKLETIRIQSNQRTRHQSQSQLRLTQTRIEILTDDLQPIILLAQHILHGNLHILERNIRRPRRPAISDLDRPRLQPLLPRNEKDRETFLRSPGGYGKVRGVHPAGDPFLGSVDDAGRGSRENRTGDEFEDVRRTLEKWIVVGFVEGLTSVSHPRS
jgi:hypothetical protein